MYSDHVERTDHGEHATPRRVVTPGPNIASVDLVRSLHMIYLGIINTAMLTAVCS